MDSESLYVLIIRSMQRNQYKNGLNQLFAGGEMLPPISEIIFFKKSRLLQWLLTQMNMSFNSTLNRITSKFAREKGENEKVTDLLKHWC